MSDILSVAEAREHLRAGGEVSDSALETLIDAAEGHVADFLGRPLIDADLGWATIEDLPPNIVHAIKIVLTWLYDDRFDDIIAGTGLRSLIGRHMVITSA